jgi:hypothetical protein
MDLRTWEHMGSSGKKHLKRLGKEVLYQLSYTRKVI